MHSFWRTKKRKSYKALNVRSTTDFLGSKQMTSIIYSEFWFGLNFRCSFIYPGTHDMHKRIRKEKKGKRRKFVNLELPM